MSVLRIEGLFETKTQLSHIGETASNSSLLVQIPIRQLQQEHEKGEQFKWEEVFAYNGNAVRGQLRDLAASYLIDKLAIEKMPLELHNLLYSGGKIGGSQKFDLENIRKYSHLLPSFSLLAGCLDNMMVASKMACHDLLPLCHEALNDLPESMHERAKMFSYADMTADKELSRKDDSKDVLLNKNLSQDDIAKKDDKNPTQMRMSSELLNSGVELFSRIVLHDNTNLDVGALCSALVGLGEFPYIGGKHNSGHGLVDIDLKINGKSFFKVESFEVETSDYFNKCLAEYDSHILKFADEIKELLS